MNRIEHRSGWTQWRIWGYLPAAFVLVAVWAQSISFAQQAQSTLKLDTGKEIFEAACAGCHGMDGKGQPVSTLGFEPSPNFPDFTDCNGSTRESSLQWSSVIHNGGPARGFAEIMPSFGPRENPALTDEQINKVIAYARTFCTEDSKWPSGNFNFPRPLFTDKSFPEDEAVLLTSVNTDGSGFENQLIYEKRFGAVSNFEMRIRGAFRSLPTGSWIGSVGDTSVEYKRTVFLNNKAGSMVAWATEVLLPTGDSKRGLGSGITKLETFLSYGQILPKQSYFQAQAGIEAPPFRRHQAPAELFVRAAAGKSFAQNRGFGRAWAPTVEFVGARELGPREKTIWDIVPQLQVTLSQRQHVRLGMGVSLPTINTTGRTAQAVFYLLWDIFDGPLTQGWR